jgi:hypothetical protein
MKVETVSADLFPIEGQARVGSLAIVAPAVIEDVAYIDGMTCLGCTGTFQVGDVVMLVRDRKGVAYIHDHDIRRERMA